MGMGQESKALLQSVYEEAGKYWKFAYPLARFPISSEQFISTNFSHPLLDSSWVRFQYETLNSINGKRGVTQPVLCFSLSRLFDSVWYANMLYDAGFEFPDSLYDDWLGRGLGSGVTVLSGGSAQLTPNHSHRKMEDVFKKYSSMEQILEILKLQDEHSFASDSWRLNL